MEKMENKNPPAMENKNQIKILKDKTQIKITG